MTSHSFSDTCLASPDMPIFPNIVHVASHPSSSDAQQTFQVGALQMGRSLGFPPAPSNMRQNMQAHPSMAPHQDLKDRLGCHHRLSCCNSRNAAWSRTRCTQR